MTTRKLACGLMILLASIASAAAPTTQSTFRFEPAGDGALKLLDAERPVLVYNHGHVANEKAPKARPRGAYVHPIYGLDREVLTDDFPADQRRLMLRTTVQGTVRPY